MEKSRNFTISEQFEALHMKTGGFKPRKRDKPGLDYQIQPCFSQKKQHQVLSNRKKYVNPEFRNTNLKQQTAMTRWKALYLGETDDLI